MLERFYRDRRRAQAGTTLVELLVSMTIIALALTLIVGTLSTGLLNATLAKRDTAAQAVLRYEMDELQATPFSGSPVAYSECFATESTAPPAAIAYQAACPDPSFSLRADVSPSAGPTATSQTWTISVIATGTGASAAPTVQVIKVNR
ncbi:MAG TPA: type II secretion system protein [Candidatus Dormibacteraeota bacterium]|nr:type II secretion system protein [Candidatus Dormibacteraeota bacterium]